MASPMAAPAPISVARMKSVRKLAATRSHDSGCERERDLRGAQVDAHAAWRALLRMCATTRATIAQTPNTPKPRPQPPATSDQ